MLIETRRLPSTSLPQGMAIAKEVERTLMRFPEVQSIVTKMGRPELATETMGLYAGDVYVNFKPRDAVAGDDRSTTLIVKMDAALKQIPGHRLQLHGADGDAAGRGDLRRPHRARREGVRRRPRRARTQGRGNPRRHRDGAGRGRRLGRRERRRDAGRAGARSARAGALWSEHFRRARRPCRPASAAREATEIIDGRKRFPVVVRLADAYRGTPEAIGRLLLTHAAGARSRCRKSRGADVVEGPERINHENGRAHGHRAEQRPRPRPRRLCGRRAARGRRRVSAARGLLRHLRRPVREPAARDAAAADHRAARPAAHRRHSCTPASATAGRRCW